MPKRHVNRLVILAAAALAVALGPVAVADASTVSVFGSQVVFTSTSATANDVTVSSASGYLVSDPNETVTAGTGCSQTTANSVTCTSGFINSIRLNLADGDDTTTVTANQNVEVYGGQGNDTLNGGPQGDQLYGEDGDDTLTGGTGPDLMDGGNGFDKVSYASRTNPVRVDLDGGWDDGEGGSPLSGEFDNVLPTVEDVTGGSGNDVFVGSAGANTFHGGDGADTIDGGAGDDTLYGDGGNDVIDGRTGTDAVDGGAGADSLTSRDSGVVDHVVCGLDTDSLVADREDDVAPGCETVDLPALAQTPTPKVDPGPVRVVTIVERTLTLSATGSKIPVKISCGADQKRDCRGTITITVKAPKRKPAASRRSGPASGSKIVVAKGKFKVKRGKTALAVAKVSKKSLKKALPAKAKRLNATLIVSMKNSDGSTTQILKPVTISTKKK
jgi:Ca2+-binding RTX toxin-like protein